MNITANQLLYILSRKYQGIRPGIDVVIQHTMIPDIEELDGYRSGYDAKIVEWKIDNIPQPTEQELEKLWSILQEQFDAEPLIPDSALYNFLNNREKKRPEITINEAL